MREATPNLSVTGAGLNYSLRQGRYTLKSTAAKIKGRKSRPTRRDKYGKEFKVLPDKVRVVPRNIRGVLINYSYLNISLRLK